MFRQNGKTQKTQKTEKEYRSQGRNMNLFYETFGDGAHEYINLRKMMLLAHRYHQGQKRKFSNIDFVFHPNDVMMLVYWVFQIRNEDLLMVCLGHDLLEDTSCSEKEILEASNENVLFDIKCLTRENIKDKTAKSAALIKKARSFTNGQKIVKCADRIVNLNDAFTEFSNSHLLLYVKESLNLINAMNENIEDDKNKKFTETIIGYLERFCNFIIKEKEFDGVDNNK